MSTDTSKCVNKTTVMATIDLAGGRLLGGHATSQRHYKCQSNQDCPANIREQLINGAQDDRSGS